jgi:tryptophanyl-tRNA synthetase
VEKELTPIRQRAKEYEENHDLVETVIAEGCEAAREEARQTLIDVREAMGLNYT